MNATEQVNRKVFEDKPGWCACFKPKSPMSRSSFTGVTVLYGKKHWVNLYEKQAANGKRYISVHVEPWREQNEKLSTDPQ